MKANFEEEIENIEKPEFVLSAHKQALFTRLHSEMNLDPIKEKAGNRMFKRFMNPKLLVPIMVVLLVAVASLFSLRLNTVAYFVTLQINPSMEIELDNDAHVIETTALNEDARILLSNLDLKTKKIDVAFEEIIKEANRLGYVGLDKKFEVSVRDARNNTASLNVSEILANIQATMTTTLKNEGLANTVNVVAVTNDQYASAKALGISPSEYMKLLEYNVSPQAMQDVVQYATIQNLDDFEDEFDDVVDAWVDMLKAGVTQEHALKVIKLALVSDKTLDKVEDIAKTFRSFIQSGLSEAAAFTKLEGIIAMDPSLDTLDNLDDDDDNDDDEIDDDDDDDDDPDEIDDDDDDSEDDEIDDDDDDSEDDEIDDDEDDDDSDDDDND